MTKHNLIETFFPRPEECVDFFVRLQKLVKASDDGKCFAELEKMDGGYYKYVLSYEEKYLGDYVKYFKPSRENIDKFNEGCKILAERLEIFIETGDLFSVPFSPPPFGELTEFIE